MRIIPLHFKLKGNNCEVEEEVAEAVEIALGLMLPLVNSAPAASFRLFSILFCFLATSLLFFYSSSNLLGSCAFFAKIFQQVFLFNGHFDAGQVWLLFTLASWVSCVSFFCQIWSGINKTNETGFQSAMSFKMLVTLAAAQQHAICSTVTTTTAKNIR